MSLANFINQIDFTNFIDPDSGWSGSLDGSCNTLLSSQDPDKFINKPSPYSIDELQHTINYNKQDTNHNNPNLIRKYPCTGDNLMKIPCWGGTIVTDDQPQDSIDAGCNQDSPLWYDKVLSKRADKFKPLTGRSIIVGQWQQTSGWGPDNVDVLPNIECLSNCSKLNYSASILVTRSSSDSITSSTPILAKIVVNIKKQTFGKAINNVNLNSSLENTTNPIFDATSLLKFSLQQNLNIGTGSGTGGSSVNESFQNQIPNKDMIKTLKLSFHKHINNTKININNLQEASNNLTVYTDPSSQNGLLQLKLANQKKMENYTKTNGLAEESYKTSVTVFSKLVEEYDKVTPLITAIVNNKKHELDRYGKNTIVDKYNKLTDLYNYTSIIGNKLTAPNPDINGIVSILKTSQSPTFYDHFKDAIMDTPAYLPISVALVCDNTCSITANVKTPQHSKYLYCNQNQDTCGENSNYSCPFSSDHTNLKWCQGIGLFKSLKVKIMKWLNTYVGSNGCIQRMLSQKYNKCLSINWPDKGNEWIKMGHKKTHPHPHNTSSGNQNPQLWHGGSGGGSGTMWNPQSNQLSFIVDKNMDSNLFKY